MGKMIILFLHFPDQEDEDGAQAACREAIEWIQRERDVQNLTSDDFTIQGTVIDT